MSASITPSAVPAVPAALAALALAAALTGPATAASTPGTHATTNLFTVSVDGVPIPQVTGVQFLDGADKPRAAGALAAATLRITRQLAGVTGTASDFLKWRLQNIGSATDRRTVTLVLLNSTGGEAGRIDLSNCVAVAWNGPTLAADGSAGTTVRESVDLACQGTSMSGGF